MIDPRVRKNVKLGQVVKVQKSGSSEIVTGIIKEIFTQKFSDPLGIEVLLVNGISGRVKEITASKEKTEEKSKTDDSIQEIITDLEKQRLTASSDLETLENKIESTKENESIKETRSFEIYFPRSSELEDLESNLIKKKEEFEKIQNKIEIARKELLNLETNSQNQSLTNSDLTIDTKMKQDLGILERQLRKIIVNGFKGIPQWWKQRLPEDVKTRSKQRKQEYESELYLQDTSEYDLIDYVDFGDYSSIICRNDNWNEIFSKILPPNSKLVFEIKMSELNVVRSHLYHNRKVSEIDRKRFDVYYNDIMRFLLDTENIIRK